MRLLILVLLSVCALTDAFVSLMCSKPTLLPRPRRPCVTGEKCPVEKYTRKDAIEQRRLEGQVYRLECLVHDLCCAIVYCDDMALMEREILQIGDIHMDLSSNMKRPPLLLRRAVADLAWKHGRPVSPPEHKWQ